MIAKYTGKAKRVDRDSDARAEQQDDPLSQRKSQDSSKLLPRFMIFVCYLQAK